jgi:pSer/pThr/pTyr-binding forkhead associated (FHA) protein
MKFSLLVLTTGKQEGKAIEIKLSQFLVGRDPQCHLRPASPMISKRHCALIQRDGKVFVRDFGSTNGTHVNDKAVEGEQELHAGDRLKIGPLLFAVQIEAGVPAPSRPTPAPPTKAGTQPASPSAKPAETAAKGPAAPSSPTPPPATVPAKPPADAPGTTPENAPAKAPAATSDEEDIAAMLLSLQDDSPTTLSGSHGPLPQVPEGSTVHDLILPSGGASGEVPPPGEGAPKGDTEKVKEKVKTVSGNTSTAAKSILEKMMRRPRPQQ